MPEQLNANSTNDNQSPFVFILGCLGGSVGILYFILFLIAGCTENPEADGSIIVDDNDDILRAETILVIEGMKFPDGLPVVVKTIESIPEKEIGTFANDLMTQDTNWQKLRPRGWMREYIKQDPSYSTGIFVLISSNPRLLQIRFGRGIRLSAYEEHIALGSWYRDRQRFDLNNLDKHLLKTLWDLSEKATNIADPPWPLSWIHYMSSMVYSEVEDIFAPSAGLYSDVVLANYIKTAHAIRATSSIWFYVLFNILFLIVVWLIVKNLLHDKLILPNVKKAWSSLTIDILLTLGFLVILFTCFASMAILSKGRIEDELALSAMGLSFLVDTSFDIDMYSTSGGFLFAIPGTIIALIGSLTKLIEYDEKSEEIHFPVVWIGWGCALYLLPKAISIIALLIVIWGTGVKLFKYVSEEFKE